MLLGLLLHLSSGDVELEISGSGLTSKISLWSQPGQRLELAATCRVHDSGGGADEFGVHLDAELDEGWQANNIEDDAPPETR
jgi:hypothetical protein